MHTRLFCKRAEFNWTLSLFVHCLTVKLARSSHLYFHRNFFPCTVYNVHSNGLMAKKTGAIFFCFVMWISEWIQYSFIIELCMWLHCSKCNKWCYCPLSKHLNRKTQAKKNHIHKYCASNNMQKNNTNSIYFHSTYQGLLNGCGRSVSGLLLMFNVFISIGLLLWI